MAKEKLKEGPHPITLPDANGNPSAERLFPIRNDGQGNPVIECRQVRVVHLNPGDAVLSVVWRRRQDGFQTDPELLDSSSRKSACRCDDDFDLVSVTADGGQVTFSIEPCDPPV